MAGLALGAGIDALLDGIGALIDDAGNVVMLPPDGSSLVFDPPLTGYYRASNNYLGGPAEPFASAVDACSVTTGCVTGNSCTPKTMAAHYGNCTAPDGTLPKGQYTLVGVLSWPAGSVLSPVGCISKDNYGAPPVGVLEDAIESGYQPHPSDYPFLAPDPAMQPTIVEVEPIPRLNIPLTTTTTVDLDTGETTVVETNIWQDFNIKDNNTNQPKIEAETTTKTETYVNGDKTSETTITNNTGFANPEGAYDSEGNRLDIPPPVDCDLFPTACAWMEWTQEEPDEPDDDLSELLQEVPIVSETFNITGGSATCPAPLVLNLSQFGSREVSYQPLCDLASTMKFLYLALMSFAAAVLLHRSISRV